MSVSTTLIVTSSGGGGLLQAANAKEQEILAKDPRATVVQCDVMKDWLWKWLGNFFVGFYNFSQRRGNVPMQSFFALVAPGVEYVFWPFIFIGSLKTLFKINADRVLDTQIFGTSAVIKAVRIYNRFSKKKMRVEKVLVDMPTAKATHFFIPIKKLSSSDRRYFRLITIRPLVTEKQSEAQFWATHTNLTAKELQYEDFYVRQSFRKFQKKQRSEETTTLQIGFKNDEELALIRRSYERAGISPVVGNNTLAFTIGPKVKVFTVLLGSQPAVESTLNYVKNWIELAKEVRVNAYLFVFCADHKLGSESLLKKVSDCVAAMSDYPPHFAVVPMSFQTDEVIAPLFHRSDITCTRSGGQTAMEIMSVATGQMWIHSEAKQGKRPLTNEDLLAGIAGWESANAAYMQQMVGAKIVTTETFMAHARPVMAG